MQVNNQLSPKDQYEKEMQENPLSVRLRRRWNWIPLWTFKLWRPVCWVKSHRWKVMPKGLPYPISYIEDDSMVIDLFGVKVTMCLRCHYQKLSSWIPLGILYDASVLICSKCYNKEDEGNVQAALDGDEDAGEIMYSYDWWDDVALCDVCVIDQKKVYADD